MKQTAVEWLSKQISSSKYFYKLMEDINSRSTVAQLDIVQQAKEMEKQQIIDAFEKGYENGACVSDEESIYHGGNYYNKTFK